MATATPRPSCRRCQSPWFHLERSLRARRPRTSFCPQCASPPPSLCLHRANVNLSRTGKATIEAAAAVGERAAAGWQCGHSRGAACERAACAAPEVRCACLAATGANASCSCTTCTDQCCPLLVCRQRVDTCARRARVRFWSKRARGCATAGARCGSAGPQHASPRARGATRPHRASAGSVRENSSSNSSNRRTRAGRTCAPPARLGQRGQQQRQRRCQQRGSC